MKKCDCCKKETPEFNLFKYTYGDKTYNLCSTCYSNVEEYLIKKGNKITLKLTPAEVKKIQVKNENQNKKLSELDLNLFPREFLEGFIDFIRKKEFTNFKRLLKQYEKEKNLKIIDN